MQQQYEARELPQPETRFSFKKSKSEKIIFVEGATSCARVLSVPPFTNIGNTLPLPCSAARSPGSSEWGNHEYFQECSRYTFINEPSEGETMCTMQV